MATTIDYVEYVCEQVRGAGDIHFKKMFGEYMVYVDKKPVLLVCDNTVFAKMLPCLDVLMADAERGHPYPSAKEHYVLDIDNAGLTRDVVVALLPVTAVPKPRKKKDDKAPDIRMGDGKNFGNRRK